MDVSGAVRHSESVRKARFLTSANHRAQRIFPFTLALIPILEQIREPDPAVRTYIFERNSLLVQKPDEKWPANIEDVARLITRENLVHGHDYYAIPTIQLGDHIPQNKVDWKRQFNRFSTSDQFHFGPISALQKIGQFGDLIGGNRFSGGMCSVVAE